MNTENTKKSQKTNENEAENIKKTKKTTENREETKPKDSKKSNFRYSNRNKKKRRFNDENNKNDNRDNNEKRENPRVKPKPQKKKEAREQPKLREFNSGRDEVESENENLSNINDRDDDLDFTEELVVQKQTEEDDEEKVEIVGVRYKPVGKIYFFDPGDTQYEINDKAIVETSRGVELGYIVIANRKVGISKIVQPFKQVQRRATPDDIEKVRNNKILAKQAMAIAEERVKAHGLKLKLIEAEYTFDNSKLLYSFTAENRIDFRELVKDLAAIFKMRIELRQIGIRDQTKIVGGLSICGRPFCCNSFLQDFEQITIKMAKEQNISINSAKISGACGKLMCCLRYEHETYEALCKDMPKLNAIVETPTGETGVVIETNILAGTCKVKINVKNNTEQGINVIKPYSKKELKPIGFVKGGESQDNNNYGADNANQKD